MAPKRKSPSPPSTSPRRSPIIKKRKIGITLAQKQALIDNLQLEITERARRLRAQYNIQAQQLRSRVEMRVNRVPTTLRKLKMEDLPKRTLNSQNVRLVPRPQYVNKPPPVPAKDGTPPKPIPRKPVPTASPVRGYKRLSTEISGADKENQGEAIDNPKKRRPAGFAYKIYNQPACITYESTNTQSFFKYTFKYSRKSQSYATSNHREESHRLINSKLQYWNYCDDSHGPNTQSSSAATIYCRYSGQTEGQCGQRIERGKHRDRGQEDNGCLENESCACRQEKCDEHNQISRKQDDLGDKNSPGGANNQEDAKETGTLEMT
ncbi:hypothetical protein RRF57_003846 [Xylaria bambusicola]|uniref:Borealin N-terminal domain-containing protein n=1 Tax=Xylaria bambusicola TaxID=326684 RepID=A0AAN7Z7Y4_9PEZI